MGEVIRLVGVGQARGWLELARAAETKDEAEALLEAHAAEMRKIRIAGAQAIRVPGRPQLRQLAGTR